MEITEIEESDVQALEVIPEEISGEVIETFEETGSPTRKKKRRHRQRKNKAEDNQLAEFRGNALVPMENPMELTNFSNMLQPFNPFLLHEMLNCERQMARPSGEGALVPYPMPPYPISQYTTPQTTLPKMSMIAKQKGSVGQSAIILLITFNSLILFGILLIFYLKQPTEKVLITIAVRNWNDAPGILDLDLTRALLGLGAGLLLKGIFGIFLLYKECNIKIILMYVGTFFLILFLLYKIFDKDPLTHAMKEPDSKHTMCEPWLISCQLLEAKRKLTDADPAESYKDPNLTTLLEPYRNYTCWSGKLNEIQIRELKRTYFKDKEDLVQPCQYQTRPMG